MPLCRSTTKKGERCQNQAQEGSDYCYIKSHGQHGYDTDKLRQQANKAIKEHRLIFIADIIAYLPCHKTTFYDHFPYESNDLKAFKEKLEKNRIDLKVSMRSKWYKSENATLQMGLMKLLSTEQERRKLAMEYRDHTSSDGSMSPKAPQSMDDWYNKDRGKEE